MKLTSELKEQLKSENPIVSKNAKDCLAIANKLMEIDDGHIWSSKWSTLTCVRWVGKGVNCKRQHEPNEIGKIFLKGINNK